MALNDDRDKALEAFLNREGSLNRLYREIPAEEPPREVDEAILAAARRATGSRPRKALHPFAARWRLPLALAASVLVSTTLVLSMRERGKMEPLAEMAAPRAEAPATPKPQAAVRAAPKAAAPAMEKPAPEHWVAERPAPAQTEPAPAAPSPPAGAAQAERFAAPTADRAAGALDGEARQRIPDANAPEAARRAAAARKPEAEEQAKHPSPETWIARIRALREQGKEGEARASLDELRKRYPDVPLPQDLQDWAARR